MNWTKEQEQAINERGKNIIVSAAAGSGKTAVLVERIRKIVVEEKTPIDKLLVVTFTNAAAAEMKEKIRNSLIDELENNPQEASFIKLQLDKLQNSYISTFHAFAIKAIRRFFYLLDVTANFKICGEDRAHIFKEDALDFVTEKYLGAGREDGILFFDSYSSDRNFRGIRELILEVYKRLMAHPAGVDLLRKFADEMLAEDGQMLSEACEKNFKEITKRSIDSAYDSIYEAVRILEASDLERLAELVRNGELATLETLKSINFDDSDWYSKVYEALSGFKASTLRSRKDETENYNKVKDKVAALRKLGKSKLSDFRDELFVNDLETEVEQIAKTLPLAKVFCDMMQDFVGYYSECKNELNLLDFNDLEHLCLKVLESEEAIGYYREKFDYVLVDEFQDTNMLQNAILEKVSSGNNLFIVGDVKQSIYKFRLAEPEIFQNIYRDYKSEDSGESIAIDLNKNYRSKQPVIDAVNTVFSKIMPGYDDAAALHCGIPYEGPYAGEVRFDIIAKEEEEKTIDEPGASEIADMASAEKEAHYVANLIAQNYGRTIWDGKKQIERPLDYSDIVILMRSKSSMETFYRVLRNKGIEASVEDIGGYFDTLEIDIFINLLSIIDNKKQDVPLISVLHSEMFGFTSAELAKIRSSKKNSTYYEAFEEYARGNDELAEKCKGFLDSIKKWKEQARFVPISDFIWQLMMETNHYLMMGAMPRGDKRQRNLKLLVEEAKKFSDSNQTDLYTFVNYIKLLKKKEFDMSQSKEQRENSDFVKIMTIHKSKGLEFPMVIVAGMGKSLNYTKDALPVSLHKDIGLGMRYVNVDEKWYRKTLPQRLIKHKIKQEEVEEEKRILYVAMTRAKDFLYLVGSAKSRKKVEEYVELKTENSTCYINMIAAHLPFLFVNPNRITVSPLGRSSENDMIVPKEVLLEGDIYAGELDDIKEKEIMDILNYEYPFEAGRSIKSKYTVSELNVDAVEEQLGQLHSKRGELISDSEFEKASEGLDIYVNLKVPKFISQEHVLTPAEKGSVYHKIMEEIDFGAAQQLGHEYIENFVSELVDQKILLQEEKDAIDISKVSGFFKTDLGKRAAESYRQGKLFKEKPFTLKKTICGESILTQGIIDCYFEEDGEIVLLDYKTNRIYQNADREEELLRIKEIYKKQIELYREALSKAKNREVKEAYLFIADTGDIVKY